PVWVQRQRLRGPDAAHVVRRAGILEGVSLAGDQLRHGDWDIGGEAPDEAPDGGPAQEEGRVRLQLEALAGVPAHEAVRAVPHRLPAERRRLPLIPRYAP